MKNTEIGNKAAYDSGDETKTAKNHKKAILLSITLTFM